jgi:hypothetical protein
MRHDNKRLSTLHDLNVTLEKPSIDPLLFCNSFSFSLTLTLTQMTSHDSSCWELVLKCYELRTRQHKMLNVNVLRPRNIIPLRIMNLGRRLMIIRLRRLSLRNRILIDGI